MIFKVAKDKKIIEQNPEIEAFEAMMKCSDRELRYIFFVYDYETPFRKMPLETRKLKAADLAGFLREKGSTCFDKNGRATINGKIPKVEAAIAEFMEMQYDQEKELIHAYNIQIQEAMDLMKKKDKTDKDWGVLLKVNKELPSIIKTKKDLELAVGYRVEEEKTDEGMEDEPLSAIDLLHIEEDGEK
jgi:hypothetical protein